MFLLNKKMCIINQFASYQIVMLACTPAYHVRKFLNLKAFLISSQTVEVHSGPVEHSKTTQLFDLSLEKDQNDLEGDKITS